MATERTQTLVVVDDDAAFLRLTSLYLSKAGFKVLEFADGLMALQHILINPPDLILADIRMPGLDGFGMLAALRSQAATAAIPVIFVTSVRDPKAQRDGMRLGADDFLVKPISRVDLLDAVNSRLERAAVLRTGGVPGPLPAAAAIDQPTLPPDSAKMLAVLREISALGEYRVLRKLGEGGASMVYLAREQHSERQLVLKIIRNEGDSADPLARRFALENAMLERVSSRHVVRVLAHGIGERYAYIAMEYFAGGTLRTQMRVALDPRRANELLREVTEGVASLHQCGIVHRDLKPENVMVRTDGSLAIADLGIASDLADGGGAEGNDIVLGTPTYLSPEQARGLPLAKPSDIYSLGVMLYEMLVGKPPFAALNVGALMHQHATAPIPQLPIGLAAYQPLIDSMLAKAPDARPADAAVLLLRLGELRRQTHASQPRPRIRGFTGPNEKLHDEPAERSPG